MIGYRSRVERDLSRWQEAGHISASGAAAIRSDLDTRAPRWALAPVLAVLGAVLLGLGAMSFIAANWQTMSKLARLTLLLGALWTSYGVAALLHRRGLAMFAEAAVLVGVGLFGASIMLIAQMYHIEGNPPDAVLLWGAGALMAGVLLASRSALSVSVAMLAGWSGAEMSLTGHVHYPFLIGWLVILAAVLWQQWRPGLHLLTLALSWWIVTLGYILPLQTGAWSLFAGGRGRHELVVALGLTMAGLAWLARNLLDRRYAFSGPAIGYGLATAFTGLFAAQFLDRVYAGTLVMLALAAVALVVAAVWLGGQRQSRGLIWLGYGGFAIETFALYVKTVGSLLGTSLFFFTAGLLIIALAWLAWWLHKRGQGTSAPQQINRNGEARA